MAKIISWFGFTLLIAAFLIWLQWPKPGISIAVCDVGQGDAVLIQQGFSQLLVDTGPPDNSVAGCLGKLMPFWDRQIETIVFSHMDSDHSGGLKTISDRYQVKQVIVSEVSLSSIKKIINTNTNIVISGQGDRWQFGQSMGQVLWPPKHQTLSNYGNDNAKESERNNNSLVWRMTYGNHSVLFTGDIDSSIEAMLAAANQLMPTDYVKISHHGSATATSKEFLDILQPRQAWISVGAKNHYSHPHQDTLRRLNDSGAEVIRTDKQGTIVLHLN